MSDQVSALVDFFVGVAAIGIAFAILLFGLWFVIGSADSE